MNTVYYSNSPYSCIEKLSFTSYIVYDKVAKTKWRTSNWFHAQERRRKITSKYSKVKLTDTVSL